jgi:hypothetical protein
VASRRREENAEKQQREEKQVPHPAEIAGFGLTAWGGADRKAWPALQGEGIAVEEVVAEIAEAFVEGLRGEIVFGGFEDEAGGAGFTGEGGGTAHEGAAEAVAAGFGGDVEVVEDPERLHGERLERRIEMHEAGGAVAAGGSIAEEEDGIAFHQARGEKAAGSAWVRRLFVELAVSVEERGGVVEMLGTCAEDADIGRLVG